MRRFIVPFLILLALPSLGTAQILFEEDFSDGTADGFRPDSGAWSVTRSGRYTVELEGYEVFSWNPFGDFAWRNYSVSAAMRSRYSSNHILAVRMQENGDCYVVNLRSKPFDDAVLSKYVDGVFHHLLFTPFRVKGEWQHLRVEAVGPTIALFRKGTEIFRHTDEEAPLLTGAPAIVALAGGLARHQELWVDEVVVEGDGFKLAVPVESTTWSGLKALYR